MEENEGPNFAFDEKIKEIINGEGLKEGENIQIVQIKDAFVELNIVKKDNEYDIFLSSDRENNKEDKEKDNGLHIAKAEIDKDGEITIQWDKEDLKKIESSDLYEELGLPKTEELEKQREDREEGEEREEGVKDNQTDETEIINEEDNRDRTNNNETNNEKKDSKAGLLELNFAGLCVLNSKLRGSGIKKGYTDPTTNKLVLEKEDGSLILDDREIEKYGFKLARSYTSAPNISDQKDGEIIERNPSNVYDIQGSNRGLVFDYGIHGREVSGVTREVGKNLPSDYAVTNSQLLVYDHTTSRRQVQNEAGVWDGKYEAR